MHFSAGSGAIKVLTVWISAFGIALTSLLSAIAGLFSPWLLPFPIISGIITIVSAVFYPPRYAAVLNGDFDGHAVRATSGVINKKRLFVPMTDLRTYEICSTPVQRFFGCRTVILRFAGGAAYFPLLPVDQAQALTAALEKNER